MRNRTPISIFPFLSVLLSTMGVLAFLAVTFLLFSRQEAVPEARSEPVEVRWVGAPPHVRPLLVECRENAVVLHSRAGGAGQTFTLAELEREVEVVRALLNEAGRRFGGPPSNTEQWLFFKESIPIEGRLKGSLTRRMHDLEIDNLTGKNREARIERYPILLIYPDGIPAYELAAFLIETTSRLSIGLEPMQKGWGLPYQEKTS